MRRVSGIFVLFIVLGIAGGALAKKKKGKKEEPAEAPVVGVQQDDDELVELRREEHYDALYAPEEETAEEEYDGSEESRFRRNRDEAFDRSVVNMALGVYFGPGVAMAAGNGYEHMSDNLTRDDRHGKLSIGSGIYFTYFANENTGAELGVGFVSKGILFKLDGSNDNEHRLNLLYLEVPFGVKVDYNRFLVGIQVAFYMALKGTRYGDVETPFTDAEWDVHRRFNFGPKISFGYAIEAGPIFVVPGLTWSMHILSDIDSDSVSGGGTYNMRFVNLMFNIGVEWAFGRKE